MVLVLVYGKRFQIFIDLFMQRVWIFAHFIFIHIHCKSDGGKIETCFTKLESNTVKIYFFICYLTIQLVKLGGFFPHWRGFQGASPIGWYSKYTC